MIFDSNSPKKIEFEIKESNIDFKSINKISARLMIEGIEYCFPGQIVNEAISIFIPQLDKIVKSGLTEGKEYDIIIEVISGTNYIIPYEDKFIVQKVAKMEIKMKDEPEGTKPVVEATMKIAKKSEEEIKELLVEESDQKKVKEYHEPKSTKDIYLESI